MTRSRVDLEIVRPTDVRSEPWANGLGVTRVLAARPDWRISIAEIEGTTRFSTFPGADRMLIPLTPAGVGLDIGGEHRRVRALEAALFRGEEPVTGHAGTRRATVINTMTRRSRARLEASIARGIDAEPSGWDAIVVLSGHVSVAGERLPPGTVLIPGRRRHAVSAARGTVALLRWTTDAAHARSTDVRARITPATTPPMPPNAMSPIVSW